MEQKNVEYLEQQILYTGFGDIPRQALWEKLDAGEQKFQIPFDTKFGSDEVKALLNFSLDKKGEWYYFNNYELSVQKQDQEAVKQTYYVQSKSDEVFSFTPDGELKRELVNSTFSLKEAYNLLADIGSVWKEYTRVEKDGFNTLGQKVDDPQSMEKFNKIKDYLNGREIKDLNVKYSSWVKLDFTRRDKYNNFPLKREPGFDLGPVLGKYPIKELQDDAARSRVLKSLQRGNPHQAVTFVENGEEKQRFIKVAVRYKGIDVMDKNMQPIRYVVGKGEAPSVVGTNQVQQDNGQKIEKGVDAKKEKPEGTAPELANEKKNIRGPKMR